MLTYDARAAMSAWTDRASANAIPHALALQNDWQNLKELQSLTQSLVWRSLLDLPVPTFECLVTHEVKKLS